MKVGFRVVIKVNPYQSGTTDNGVNAQGYFLSFTLLKTALPGLNTRFQMNLLVRKWSGAPVP